MTKQTKQYNNDTKKWEPYMSNGKVVNKTINKVIDELVNKGITKRDVENWMLTYHPPPITINTNSYIYN